MLRIFIIVYLADIGEGVVCSTQMEEGGQGYVCSPLDMNVAEEGGQ